MTGPEQAARTRATKRLVMVVAGGIAGVAIALAAVYGINTIQRNAGDAACAGAAGQLIDWANRRLGLNDAPVDPLSST